MIKYFFHNVPIIYLLESVAGLLFGSILFTLNPMLAGCQLATDSTLQLVIQLQSCTVPHIVELC